VKFGITARITLALALAGALAASLTGYYALNASRALLVQSAQDELLLSTQVLARRVAVTRQEVSRNLQVLATHPSALAAVQRGGANAETQLATLFKVLMEANSAYLQIRLISAAEHGLERVRVDRDSGATQTIRGDDLQEKGHFSYVFETLKLRAGETFLSQIAINHEAGSHAGLGRPTVVLASPVVDARGLTLGLVVINLDLNATFQSLAADLPRDYTLYLANSHGDLLIHPDPAQAFGFDKGRRYFVQDEFHELQDLVGGTVQDRILLADTGTHAAQPLLAAFISRNIAVRSDEGRIVLGLSRPLQAVLRQNDLLGHNIAQLVLLVCLGCILLAVLVARALTRPINSVITAVHRFSSDNQASPLPVERSDEIGVLARSLVRMQGQIRQQLDVLQDNQKELEHLAQHDTLTSLPNRRRFMDRLDMALERAKRTGHGFALLFIDIDNFKTINDSLGHATGDAVLLAVAQRLAQSTRKVDTAARLGGDEFVLMLDQFTDHDLIAGFTEKLLHALKAPIHFEGHTLHVEFSIGISRFPLDGETAETLLHNADAAMYRIKSGGRNGYRFASDNDTQPSLL
jgi:diguanylate cyclase